MILPVWSEKGLGDLVMAFVRRSLAKSEWTHAAHLAVGLWYLRHRRAEVQEGLPAAIRASNEATDVANTPESGYHETITQSSLRALASARDAQPSAALQEVGARVARIEEHERRWPCDH